MRARIDGGGYSRQLVSDILNLKVSEDGWRTNKMIQMVAGSKGATGAGELMKKPGWIGRNITKRGWEKEAAESGATVVR